MYKSKGKVLIHHITTMQDKIVIFSLNISKVYKFKKYKYLNITFLNMQTLQIFKENIAVYLELQ